MLCGIISIIKLCGTFKNKKKRIKITTKRKMKKKMKKNMLVFETLRLERRMQWEIPKCLKFNVVLNGVGGF